MNFFKNIACLSALIAVLALQSSAFAQEAAAPEKASEKPQLCGDREMTIARMGWPSARILSQVHALILRGAFGCETRLVAGDTSSTGSAMATAQLPAIAPELWVSRIPEVWNAARTASSVLKAGNTFGPGDMQGWFVPKYVFEANPALVKLSDLKDHWQVFRPSPRTDAPARAGSTDADKAAESAESRAAATGPGQFVSCPKDWACAIINRNMIKALGLEKRIEIVTPEDGPGLDREITKALSRKQPILFYYWQPTATLAQFEFKMLKPGSFNADGYNCNAKPDCAKPSASGFGSEAVIIAMASWVQRTAPAVAEYFNLASMPLDSMNSLLAWQNELGAEANVVASYFIEVNQPIWSKWLTKSQLENMQAAIKNGLLNQP